MANNQQYETRLERSGVLVGNSNDNLAVDSLSIQMKMALEDWVFVIFITLGVILALWYIFGSSPTLEQALLMFLIGLTSRNHAGIKYLKGRVLGIERRMDDHLQSHK